MDVRDFSKALTIEPATTKDARGRVLQEGDEIILNVKGPLYFRVSKIEPVPLGVVPPGADPAQVRSLLYVHVGCMLTFSSAKGQINAEFIRVRSAQEAGPSPFTLMDILDAGKPAGEV